MKAENLVKQGISEEYKRVGPEASGNFNNVNSKIQDKEDIPSFQLRFADGLSASSCQPAPS